MLKSFFLDLNSKFLSGTPIYRIPNIFLKPFIKMNIKAYQKTFDSTFEEEKFLEGAKSAYKFL
jgi:hypothetical protein